MGRLDAWVRLATGGYPLWWLVAMAAALAMWLR